MVNWKQCEWVRGEVYLIQYLPGVRVWGSSWLDSLWPTGAAGSQSTGAVGWWSHTPGGGWFPWRQWWCLGGRPSEAVSWGCVQASATEEQTLWYETSSHEFVVQYVATCRVSCVSYSEQDERSSDDVQDVEVFCSNRTVQRKPVCREDKLQKGLSRRKHRFNFSIKSLSWLDSFWFTVHQRKTDSVRNTFTISCVSGLYQIIFEECFNPEMNV